MPKPDPQQALYSVLDTIAVLIAIYRSDGIREFVNKAWQDYTGIPLAAAIGRDWSITAHPDDREEGDRRWRACMASGEPLYMEQRYRRADGEYRWHMVRRVPLRDAEGRLVQWYSVADDIEDRKRAEEALLAAQAQLAHAGRVAMLGEFSASIAHEVSQPLTAIVTNAEAGARWLDRPDPRIDAAIASLRRVSDDARRAGEIMRHIRMLAKRADPALASLDINNVVREALALVRREILHQGVSLRLDLAEGLPGAWGDRIQLQQVITNLVVNAMQAVATADQPKTLTVRTARAEGNALQVAVEDTGIGIAPETVGRVFDAFFTTKADGMGMGLAISRSIIEAHRGAIWATRNANGGMTFQFTVPAAEGTGKAQA